MDNVVRHDDGVFELEGGYSAPVTESCSTIVIIERRALFRECLARCVAQETGHTVETFADRDSWSRQRGKFRPSLIILGNLEAGAEGEMVEAVRDLVKGDEGAPVVVISDAVDTNRVLNAFRCGARGVIPFDTTIEITVGAIRLTLVGGVYVPPAVVFSDANTCHGDEKASLDLGKAVFTARENAVIQALRKGKANKVIASDLHVSESTVKVHVHNVMRKLRVSNRTEAVIKIGELAPEPLAVATATTM